VLDEFPLGASQRVIEGEIIGFSPSTRDKLRDQQNDFLHPARRRGNKSHHDFFPKAFIRSDVLPWTAAAAANEPCRRRNSGYPQAAAAV
jgi:hypothetical protein